MREIEVAFMLAVRAFAQYALDTDEPPREAVEEFAEGFRQQARLDEVRRV